MRFAEGSDENEIGTLQGRLVDLVVYAAPDSALRSGSEEVPDLVEVEPGKFYCTFSAEYIARVYEVNTIPYNPLATWDLTRVAILNRAIYFYTIATGDTSIISETSIG